MVCHDSQKYSNTKILHAKKFDKKICQIMVYTNEEAEKGNVNLLAHSN